MKHEHCVGCPLNRRTYVGHAGDLKTCEYILIGEAPARDEVRKKTPFVGATGRLFRKLIAKVRIKEEDCYITNAVKCMIPSRLKGKDKQKVLAAAIKHCRPLLVAELAEVPENVRIAAMGKGARDALLPHLSRGGVLASRGWYRWKDRDVLVTVHPAFVLHNQGNAPMFLKDMARLKNGPQPPIGPFEVARAIPLSGEKGKGKVTWVSEEDYEWAKQWKWHCSHGYAAGACRISLHGEVLEQMGHDPSLFGKQRGDLQADHINRDRLDNRRSNLRAVTISQARLNRGPKSGTSSKYKGVCYAPQLNATNPWLSTVAHEWGGYHATEIDAARAYDNKIQERNPGEIVYLNFPPKAKPEYVGWVLDTPELLQGLIDKLKAVPLADRSFVAYDLETDDIDYQRDRILCMSLCFESGTGYIIPDSLLYKDGRMFVTTGATKEQVLQFLDSFKYYLGNAYGEPNPETVELLNEMFSIPGYRWAAHNSKFDLRFLQGQLGVTAAHTDFDTIVAHYALDERKGGHALKPLADDYFDSGDYEAGIKKWLPSKWGRFSMIPRKELYKYNLMDSEITRRFAVRFEADMKAEGTYKQPFMFPMMKAYSMLLAMELHGININWEELERFAEEEILPGSDALKEELRTISGHPDLNPASSQQMIKVVYDELKFPLVSFRRRSQGTKVRGRTTEKGYVMACEELWKKGKLPVTKAAWGFLQKLKEYRHVYKMYSTYTKNWQRHRGTDGRVHPTYQLRGTVTGRLSVVDPPVQTIPNKNRDRWSTGIANIHVPAPGRVLLYADFSQAELRIAGALAMDKFMLAAFKEGAGEFHTAVALQAYGQDFTSDERGFCKRVAYGWLYGGNVYEIALEALHFTEELSRKLDTSWNAMFHRTNEWRKEVEADVKRLGYSESILGRRRRFPLISRATLFRILRMAINSRIQGASSDMVLISAMELHERYKDSGYAWVILMVHDSLIMEVEESHAGEVKVVMRQTMESVASRYFPQVPHEAEVKIGMRLGDLMG